LFKRGDVDYFIAFMNAFIHGFRYAPEVSENLGFHCSKLDAFMELSDYPNLFHGFSWGKLPMEIPMEISKTHPAARLPGGGGWQDDLPSGAVRCPADVGKVWRQVRRPSDADLLGGPHGIPSGWCF